MAQPEQARESTKAVRTNDATRNASVARVDMKLEVVVIPVSDVDRAKDFYGRLGWRLDADFASGDDFRVIQFTPPGSGVGIRHKSWGRHSRSSWRESRRRDCNRRR